MHLSLPYVETFNSKVIKGFVPELRSRYVFFVFRDSYVLCIYVMNILCTFHIFMYGYVTIFTNYRAGDIKFAWFQKAFLLVSTCLNRANFIVWHVRCPKNGIPRGFIFFFFFRDVFVCLNSCLLLVIKMIFCQIWLDRSSDKSFIITNKLHILYSSQNLSEF